jgi:hypothetical protein
MTQDTAAPARVVGCDVGKAGIVVFDSRDGGIRTIHRQESGEVGPLIRRPNRTPNCPAEE